MFSFRPAADGVKVPSCPTCSDTGVLPDPCAVRAGDTISCPVSAPHDSLRDALQDVQDALQRALGEAEGPGYRRPGSRALHETLSEWSRQAAAWLAERTVL